MISPCTLLQMCDEQSFKAWLHRYNAGLAALFAIHKMLDQELASFRPSELLPAGCFLL
jgi:hypothetical protein